MSSRDRRLNPSANSRHSSQVVSSHGRGYGAGVASHYDISDSDNDDWPTPKEIEREREREREYRERERDRGLRESSEYEREARDRERDRERREREEGEGEVEDAYLLSRSHHAHSDASYHDNDTDPENTNEEKRGHVMSDLEGEEGSSNARRNGSYSDTGADQIPQQRKAKIYSRYRKKVRRKTHLPKTERERLRVQPQRRPSRESLLYDETSDVFRVSAFCTCDRYNLSDIIEFVEGIEGFADSVALFADVVQIKQKSHRRDIFVFSYGCVCFFNMPEQHEAKFLRLLRQFEVGSLPIDQHQFEDFDCVYGEQSDISNDTITLRSRSSLEKLSVAFAMAQCVKLSVYEDRISQEMEENQLLPISLARTGSVGLSQKSISKMIGKLFIERNNVNLHFDVLDTPEFFWEQDKFKPVYDRLFNYLELGKRVELLNKRLDIMKELLDMLSSEQQAKHASKLEWIIIWLIVFEVLITLCWDIIVKDILGFF